MKPNFLSILGMTALVFVACSNGPNVRDPQLFRTKTGVIGVFRQPAFYCSEANPHYMRLGDSTVIVKPTWSEDQDNMFLVEHKPGNATLYWYAYTCGENENKFVLDTAESSKNPGPIGVVVPEQGFCKTVISFVQGDKLFSQDNDVLHDMAVKEKMGMNIDEIPFCEVFDNTGSKVSFADKDSLLVEQYNEAVVDASDATSEEIYPLVRIDSTEESDRVTWNSDKSKVLMAVLGDRPDMFEDGRTLSMDKEIWVVSERELYQWYKDNKASTRSWPLRLRQLFGLPKNERVTHFSLIWVYPRDLVRPAYVTDIASSEMTTSFADELESDSTNTERMMWFKNWFDDEYSKSYVKGARGRTWTRLGYTYDWGSKSSNKYGLSQFLVVPGAEVEVRFTKNIKAYIQWMNDRNN